MLQVVRRLREAGHEALCAGGCVRDMLLGQRPQDYDVATSAHPEAVMALFNRTLAVGAQFGVVIVLVGGRQVEVATFRSDLAYVDGRRPEQVVYTTAREDAERRDFTINGMFYDPVTETIIDYVGGQEDLQRRLVRAIGDAEARFAEDHLRMLRALRFAARLDFEIEQNTHAAIVRHASQLARISAERVAAELEKILTDPSRPRGLALAAETGLLKVMLPRLDETARTAGRAVVEHLPERGSYPLTLAALLSGTDAATARRVCRDLRTSNDVRQQVGWLLEALERLPGDLPLSKGRLKRWVAQPLWKTLLTLWEARCRSRQETPTAVRRLRRQVRMLGDEAVAPPPLLNGHDLIRLGAAPGPTLGRLVEDLYLAQLEGEVRTVAQAEAWAQQWLAAHRERAD